jgi:hypothetical protein
MRALRWSKNMNEKNRAAIEAVITRATADQVKRTLDVMRIRGWRFPEQCAVGVKVLASTALVTQVAIRIDDVSAPSANVTTEAPRDDIAKVVDSLVAEWLSKHATERPGARHE